MNYTHLTQDERYQIAILSKAGHDRSGIAQLMDRHKSTIDRVGLFGDHRVSGGKLAARLAGGQSGESVGALRQRRDALGVSAYSRHLLNELRHTRAPR